MQWLISTINVLIVFAPKSLNVLFFFLHLVHLTRLLSCKYKSLSPFAPSLLSPSRSFWKLSGRRGPLCAPDLLLWLRQTFLTGLLVTTFISMSLQYGSVPPPQKCFILNLFQTASIRVTKWPVDGTINWSSSTYVFNISVLGLLCPHASSRLTHQPAWNILPLTVNCAMLNQHLC